MHKLSTYEHHEIFTFPHIYFVGQNAKKKQGVPGGAQNCGYDDDQGSYLLVAHDHIQYRYEVIKIIGKSTLCPNCDRCSRLLPKLLFSYESGRPTV